MPENKEFFMKRYRQLYPGTELEEEPLEKSLRINTLKIKKKDLIDRLKKEKVSLEKIPFLEHGYRYSASFSLGSTPEYLQGYYYLQETSSQVPVEVLAPKKGHRMLDMAAAPGSKTTQSAQHMENKGSILALDNNRWRLFALRNNLERLGVMNTLIYNKDARFIYDFGQRFDRILLDAPCTGNFFTDSDWFSKRTIEDIKNRSKLQKELLRTAVEVLDDKGLLVYSTCSLEPEENEMVISWALENLGIKLEKIEIPVGEPGLTDIFGKDYPKELKKCLRILPGKQKIQPFFIAKIRKK